MFPIFNVCNFIFNNCNNNNKNNNNNNNNNKLDDNNFINIDDYLKNCNIKSYNKIFNAKIKVKKKNK